MREIFIRTMTVCSALTVKVYLDGYHLADREFDKAAYQRYALAETAEQALRIEYVSYYNGIQKVLTRLIVNGVINKRIARHGFDQWLKDNPIPTNLPRTLLSTVFCEVPVPIMVPQGDAV